MTQYVVSTNWGRGIDFIWAVNRGCCCIPGIEPPVYRYRLSQYLLLLLRTAKVLATMAQSPFDLSVASRVSIDLPWALQGICSYLFIEWERATHPQREQHLVIEQINGGGGRTSGLWVITWVTIEDRSIALVYLPSIVATTSWHLRRGG